MAEQPATGVLDHVNVLDMSWVAAGPLCGVLFAYYGATVVRVESAVRTDLARNSPPLTGRGINKSAYYASMNLGKYDVCLDLNNERGRDVVARLVDWADVVIEGFTPGTMAQWGLDYERLRARKPGIIMISLTLQGQTGPLASMRGYGLQVHGMSGMASLIGWRTRTTSCRWWRRTPPSPRWITGTGRAKDSTSTWRRWRRRSTSPARRCPTTR